MKLELLRSHESVDQLVDFFLVGENELYSNILFIETKCIKILSIENGIVIKKIELFDFNTKITKVLLINDSTLLFLNDNRTLTKYDFKENSSILTWSGHSSHTTYISKHNQIPLIATGHVDHTISIFDIDKGICTHRLKGHHGGSITFLEFLSHKKTLSIISGATDGSIVLWTISGSKVSTKVFNFHNSSITFIYFDENEQTIISSAKDSTIKKFNLEGKLLFSRFSDSILLYSSINDKGKIFSLDEQRYIKVWNASNLDLCIKSQKEMSKVQLTSFRIFNDLLFISDINHDILIVDSNTMKIEKVLSYQSLQITDLCSFNNGRCLAIVSNQKDLLIYNDFQKSGYCSIKSGHTGEILAISKIDNFLLTGSSDTTIGIFSIKNLEFDGFLPGHTDSVALIRTSHLISGKSDKESFFVSLSLDSCIKFWNFSNKGIEKISCKWTFKSENVNDISITSDNKCIIVAQGKLVTILSLDGVILNQCSGHDKVIWSVDFCLEKNEIITSSSEGIKFWNLKSLKCTSSWNNFSQKVHKALFLDKNTMLTFEAAGAIKLWNIKRRELLDAFDYHKDRVTSTVFDSLDDKKILYTGDVNGQINLWSLQWNSNTTLASTNLLESHYLEKCFKRKDWKEALKTSINLKLFKNCNLIFDQIIRDHSLEKSIEIFEHVLSDPLIENDCLIELLKHNILLNRNSMIVQIFLNALLKIYPLKNFNHEIVNMLKFSCSKMLKKIKDSSSTLDFIKLFEVNRL